MKAKIITIFLVFNQLQSLSILKYEECTSHQECWDKNAGEACLLTSESKFKINRCGENLITELSCEGKQVGQQCDPTQDILDFYSQLKLEDYLFICVGYNEFVDKKELEHKEINFDLLVLKCRPEKKNSPELEYQSRLASVNINNLKKIITKFKQNSSNIIPNVSQLKEIQNLGQKQDPNLFKKFYDIEKFSTQEKIKKLSIAKSTIKEIYQKSIQKGLLEGKEQNIEGKVKQIKSKSMPPNQSKIKSVSQIPESNSKANEVQNILNDNLPQKNSVQSKKQSDKNKKQKSVQYSPVNIIRNDQLDEGIKEILSHSQVKSITNNNDAIDKVNRQEQQKIKSQAKSHALDQFKKENIEIQSKDHMLKMNEQIQKKSNIREKMNKSEQNIKEKQSNTNQNNIAHPTSYKLISKQKSEIIKNQPKIIILENKSQEKKIQSFSQRNEASQNNKKLLGNQEKKENNLNKSKQNKHKINQPFQEQNKIQKHPRKDQNSLLIKENNQQKIQENTTEEFLQKQFVFPFDDQIRQNYEDNDYYIGTSKNILGTEGSFDNITEINQKKQINEQGIGIIANQNPEEGKLFSKFNEHINQQEIVSERNIII